MHGIIVMAVLMEAARSQESKREPQEPSATAPSRRTQTELPKQPFTVLFGNAQDAGYPQAGCQED
jgi:hypothetical protein